MQPNVNNVVDRGCSGAQRRLELRIAWPILAAGEAETNRRVSGPVLVMPSAKIQPSSVTTIPAWLS
jgi:hypothetical protein